MKKNVLVLVALMLGCCVSCADNRPIAFTELPKAAQSFVQQYFPASANPAFQSPIVTKDTEWFDDAPYEVMFTTGDKVSFTSKGAWKEFEGRTVPVPDAIIPANIKAWVAQSYPGASIVKIDKDSRDIEIKLSNMIEVKFDLKGNIMELDIDD